jgi:hypothetical protein
VKVSELFPFKVTLGKEDNENLERICSRYDNTVRLAEGVTKGP